MCLFVHNQQKRLEEYCFHSLCVFLPILICRQHRIIYYSISSNVQQDAVMNSELLSSVQRHHTQLYAFIYSAFFQISCKRQTTVTISNYSIASINFREHSIFTYNVCFVYIQLICNSKHVVKEM